MLIGLFFTLYPIAINISEAEWTRTDHCFDVQVTETEKLQQLEYFQSK